MLILHYSDRQLSIQLSSLAKSKQICELMLLNSSTDSLHYKNIAKRLVILKEFMVRMLWVIMGYDAIRGTTRLHYRQSRIPAHIGNFIELGRSSCMQ